MTGVSRTHQEFMRKFERENSTLFQQVEVLGEYTNQYNPLKAICKYGKINIIPKNTLKASKLSIGWAENKTEFFIRRGQEKHDSKYTYDKARYVSSRDYVLVTCTIHGDFSVTPAEHLSGTGCNDCGNILTGIKERTRTHRQFMDEWKNVSLEVYSSVTLLEDYTTMRKWLLGYNKYGFVKVYPKSVLKGNKVGRGVAICKSIYVCNQFQELHRDMYDYHLVDFIHKDTPTTIICSKHGPFSMSPGNHLSGGICPTCSTDLYKQFGTRDHSQVYTRTSYIKRCNGRESNCYTIKCFSDTEEFYKIGIALDIKKRFQGKRLPYKYRIIKKFKGSAGFVWDKEKALHRIHRIGNLSYVPRESFQGDTECFTDILWEEINKEFKK